MKPTPVCLTPILLLIMLALTVSDGVSVAKDSAPLPPVKQQVANSKSNCLDLDGTFSVRWDGNRAITECQYPSGDYTTCELTPTNIDCHSLEVDIQTPPKSRTDDVPVTPIAIPPSR